MTKTFTVQCGYTFDPETNEFTADLEKFELISMKYYLSDDIKNNTAPYIEAVVTCSDDVYNLIATDESITITDTGETNG